MRRLSTLLITVLILLGLLSIPDMTATTFTVDTPVAKTLVSATDDNYEYKVSVNVTVSTGNTEVNILMFGNRDNSAFVEGDNALKLTVGEIVSEYNVYYINRKPPTKTAKFPLFLM